MVKRHGLVTRITHWINVAALFFLLGSGLQIFNAHPSLYWGQASTFAKPWVAIGAAEKGPDLIGVTMVGGKAFETTGVLGYSGKPGAREPRAFPAWATIPSYRSLAEGRRWHFFFAWIFVLNGLVYLLAALGGGHLVHDLWPGRDQLKLRHILREIGSHARLKFPKGEEARRYNVLQKLTYLAVILVLLPLMLGTGLSMSPGMNAAAPWLLDIFGGRQSARTIHFLAAGLIVLFTFVHLLMILAAGLWNNIRSMVTGKYAIEVEGDRA